MVTKIGLYRDPRNKGKPWVVRWFGEYDPASGKQRRYSQSFRTKARAEQFAAQKMVEFAEGVKRDKPDKVTLKAFCRDCIKVKKTELRPASMELYRQTIERLQSYFGSDCLVSNITPRAAARFIAEQKPQNAHCETLSNWTRHKITRNCRALFQYAVDWELIKSNPFKKVKGPKCITRQWHYVTVTEFNRLLYVAPTLRWKALYSLAFTAGLRKGELLSLTWKDVDFERHEVSVRNRPATAQLPPFELKDYESRTIPLPQQTVDLLVELQNEAPESVPFVLMSRERFNTVVAKWKRFQQEGREWLTDDWGNNTLREFKRHVSRAEIKPNGTLNLHTLRKSCILNWSNSISNPEVVRVLAGHSDLKTTMKYYSQITAEQSQKAAAAIEKLLATAEQK